MSFTELKQYLETLEGKKGQMTYIDEPSCSVVIKNNNLKPFRIDFTSFRKSIEDILENVEEFKKHTKYNEANWRKLIETLFSDPEAKALGGTQTRPYFSALASILSKFSKQKFDPDIVDFDSEVLKSAISFLKEIENEYSRFPKSAKNNSKFKGRNIIYYGAPGTGKSYDLRNLQNIFRTVFHAEYQNSDFIGSYRPYIENGQITYSFNPGPFIDAYIEAISNSDQEINLIIEEINRGNCASIFGEVFQLLDRDKNGSSEYEIKPERSCAEYISQKLNEKSIQVNANDVRIKIPSNLSIHATMNSSDQGVTTVDSAFKRRWEFEYKTIIFNENEHPYLDEKNIEYLNDFYSYKQVAESINDILLSEGIEEDRLIGQFFLNQHELLDVNIKRTITGKLFLYLWDDVLRHGSRQIIFNVEDFKSLREVMTGFLNGKNVFSELLSSKLLELHAVLRENE